MRRKVFGYILGVYAERGEGVRRERGQLKGKSEMPRRERPRWSEVVCVSEKSYPRRRGNGIEATCFCQCHSYTPLLIEEIGEEYYAKPDFKKIDFCETDFDKIGSSELDLNTINEIGFARTNIKKAFNNFDKINCSARRGKTIAK
jgi:hypothetical protein